MEVSSDDANGLVGRDRPGRDGQLELARPFVAVDQDALAAFGVPDDDQKPVRIPAKADARLEILKIADAVTAAGGCSPVPAALGTDEPQIGNLACGDLALNPSGRARTATRATRARPRLGSE